VAVYIVFSCSAQSAAQIVISLWFSLPYFFMNYVPIKRLINSAPFGALNILDLDRFAGNERKHGPAVI